MNDMSNIDGMRDRTDIRDVNDMSIIVNYSYIYLYMQKLYIYIYTVVLYIYIYIYIYFLFFFTIYKPLSGS